MKQFARSGVLAIALIASVALSTGCSDSTGGMSQSNGNSKSLYDRLGGESAITAVVEDFVARAANDAKLNFTRKGTGAEFDPNDRNMARLKRNLIDFVCMATGGPQRYSGRAIKQAHAGMRITDGEFNASASDLKATLDKFNVPAREQKELLDIVSTTRNDIVEIKSMGSRTEGEPEGCPFAARARG